jgi:hypothetical protein
LLHTWISIESIISKCSSNPFFLFYFIMCLRDCSILTHVELIFVVAVCFLRRDLSHYVAQTGLEWTFLFWWFWVLNSRPHTC